MLKKKKKAEPEKKILSLSWRCWCSLGSFADQREGHDRQLHCILGNIFKAEEGSERCMCQLQRMETHRGDTAQDRSRSHHCKRPLLAQQPDSPPGSSKMQLLND